MKKLIVMFVGAYLLQACVVVDTVTMRGWELQQQQNREDIASLQTGVSINAVLAKMGTPEFNEIQESNAGMAQVLYYRTQRVRDDGNTSKDECTPLLFVDGKLKGWGYRFLNDSGIWI